MGILRRHLEGQVIEVGKPTDEVHDISRVSSRCVEMERTQSRNKVGEISIELFEELRGVEPVYAQFLDPVEALEMAVERLKISRGEVLVDIDKELTAVGQQPVGGHPG